MAGKPDRDALLENGIRAGQSTPLIARSGKLVGMISTHWAQPHRPPERALRTLDILARSAADLVERRRTAQTQKLLINELNHRVKNTLAVVQAMAQRTLAKSSDPKVFAVSFGGRVQALARAHSMLSERSWQPADLRDMISDQMLLGSSDAGRVSAVGPAVKLDAQSALHMALILHELGTNATKYGALFVATGEVAVEWTVGDALRVRWKERGGPRVKPSLSKGFGTTLIAQSVKGQGGEAHMTSEPEGITWRFVIPIGSGIACESESAPGGAALTPTKNVDVSISPAGGF
jgi:two-component sensor histidine kinase